MKGGEWKLVDTSRKEASPVTIAPATTSTSSAGKRRAPEEGRPKAFAPRRKQIAHRPKRVERVTISEDSPSASSPPPLAPAVNVDIPSPTSLQEMPLFPSSSLPEDGADSGSKVSVGYSTNFLNLPYMLPGGLRVIEDSTLWKKPHAFQATRPLILELVAKDFDEVHDPMEVEASITPYFIKALNTNHSLAHRSDALDNARVEACEGERALRLQVQELTQKNEDLKGDKENFKGGNEKLKNHSRHDLEGAKGGPRSMHTRGGEARSLTHLLHKGGS
ncbi:hypothetical protein LIER_30007 [Lithospermum erythrorhizon]|uniref:Uncharacterized protein n=1 Tax=Lithospermum erythrorhizon TaxID=34254 RepID=A0AAV3RLJ1_LITER